MITIGAASPNRGPLWMIRVYPPGRSESLGTRFENNLSTTSGLEISSLTLRRAVIPVLGGGDEALDPPPQLFGASLGRRDASARAFQERRAQVAHQRLARVGVPVEAAAALLVAHGSRLAAQ